MGNIMSERRKKKENFKRLAEKRTTKVILAIDNLSKLSNRQNYEYNEQEITQMINTLKNEINDLNNKFKNEVKNKVFKFN
jgi:hypothetical protein